LHTTMASALLGKLTRKSVVPTDINNLVSSAVEGKLGKKS